ncbi:MAG: hypothetical protein ACTHLE_12830 [Agriterribacter sp.]
MKEFISLNRHKIIGMFFKTSLILSGAAFLFLSVGFLSSKSFDLRLVLSIFLSTCILFPLLVTGLSYFMWLISHRQRKKMFSRNPLSQLESVGFYTALLNFDSKWSFTETIKERKLNGFRLRCGAASEKSNTIEFEVPVEWKHLDKQAFNRLNTELLQQNIELRIGTIVKVYNLRELATQTITQLDNSLQEFTEILRVQGFAPASQ